MSDERGSIIVGWLTKIVVVFTVLGVLGFDLIAVATTKLGATDDATHAARAGATAYRETRGDVQEAYAAALAYAEKKGGSIEPDDFIVQPDGTIHVTVRKTATTLVFYRTGATKKWTEISADGESKAP